MVYATRSPRFVAGANRNSVRTSSETSPQPVPHRGVEGRTIWPLEPSRSPFLPSRGSWTSFAPSSGGLQGGTSHQSAGFAPVDEDVRRMGTTWRHEPDPGRLRPCRSAPRASGGRCRTRSRSAKRFRVEAGHVIGVRVVFVGAAAVADDGVSFRQAGRRRRDRDRSCRACPSRRPCAPSSSVKRTL